MEPPADSAAEPMNQAINLAPPDPLAPGSLLPRKVYNDNTGVDLTEFHYFRKLPPELRNMIYKLLLISKRTIQISSPLGKRQHNRAPNFAPILATNKATYEEARSIYYLCNTFAVGNNTYGSRHLANLHGLREFMKVATKPLLAQLTSIEINVCAEKHQYADPLLQHKQFYLFESEKGRELRSICLILLKHFRGLNTITIRACELQMRPIGFNQLRTTETHPLGDFETAGDALKLLLDGNRKGERGYGPLNVGRFWWYQAEKIFWHQDRDGNKNHLNSFAGYVEGNRPALKDRHGKWRQWGVTDDSVSVLRMYERMGIM